MFTSIVPTHATSRVLSPTLILTIAPATILAPNASDYPHPVLILTLSS